MTTGDPPSRRWFACHLPPNPAISVIVAAKAGTIATLSAASHLYAATDTKCDRHGVSLPPFAGIDRNHIPAMSPSGFRSQFRICVLRAG
jgi:hypothetical protein